MTPKPTPRTDSFFWILRPQPEALEFARQLEREITECRDANEDMRDLLREIYNLTQLDRDCPVDLPHRALVHIGHIIEEKTPPTTP